jgi:hypothetical protein
MPPPRRFMVLMVVAGAFAKIAAAPDFCDRYAGDHCDRR